jgi:hypothetical protein
MGSMGTLMGFTVQKGEIVVELLDLRYSLI